jgi:hypothetical protein
MITVYVGIELREVRRRSRDRGEFLEPVVLPFDLLLTLVRRNVVIDSKTVFAALYWERERALWM